MTASIPNGGSRAGAIFRVTSGNFLEQFDFFLFGFYATQIAAVFFPASSEFASLMMTFAVFGAGFLMRPLGAIVLGAYIDDVGRRKGLIVTLSIMASGTILIVLVPGYKSIGLFAPALVLIGRLLQGFSAGAELGGGARRDVDGGADHHRVLPNHRLRADLRQNRAAPEHLRCAARDHAGGGANFFWLPIGGALSDRIGRRQVLIAMSLLALATTYPALSYLVQAPSFSHMLLSLLWLSFIYGIYNGAMIPSLTEIMPVEVRVAGFSLAYSLATAIFGGFTPAMSTFLIQYTGDKAAPGYWMSVSALCSLCATLYLYRRAGGRLQPVVA